MCSFSLSGVRAALSNLTNIFRDDMGITGLFPSFLLWTVNFRTIRVQVDKVLL